MRKLAVTGFVIGMAGMVGCATPRYADVPAPTRFENTKQQKLQAAEHWRTIAEHFAAQLAADLQDKLGARAVYVPQPGGEQAFVEGFRELLITSLVARGLPVSTEARNALTVDVRYSVYRFRPERVQSTRYYGEATALAAGVWALGSVLVGDLSQAVGVEAGAKLLASAAAIDGFEWIGQEALGRGQFAAGPVPRSEILLTASIADGARIVIRRSNIYYTADEDSSLYWNRPAVAGTIPVRGDCGEGVPSCGR